MSKSRTTGTYGLTSMVIPSSSSSSSSSSSKSMVTKNKSKKFQASKRTGVSRAQSPVRAKAKSKSTPKYFSQLPHNETPQNWLTRGLNSTIGALGRATYHTLKKTTGKKNSQLFHNGPMGIAKNVIVKTSEYMLTKMGNALDKVSQNTIKVPNSHNISSILSPKQASSRRDRLKKGDDKYGKVITVYHKTDPNIAASIISSQTFIRGSKGMVGAAIYFADNPRDTWTKAVGSQGGGGTILKCKINIGKVKELSDYPGEEGPYLKWMKLSGKNATLKNLNNEGCDSILYKRNAHTSYSNYCAPNTKRYDKETKITTNTYPNREWVIFAADQVINGSIVVHWYNSNISAYTLYSNNYITYNIEFNDSTWQNEDNQNKNCNQQQLLPPDFQTAEAQQILLGQYKSIAYRNNKGKRQVKVTGKKKKRPRGKHTQKIKNKK